MNTESCPSGRRCSTRNAVYVKYLGFESLTLRHKSTVILIELRWAFSITENRLELGFSAVSAHKRTLLRSNSAAGFVRFMVDLAFCAVVIVKQPSSDNTPYEKIGDEVRLLEDGVPFDIPDSLKWGSI